MKIVNMTDTDYRLFHIDGKHFPASLSEDEMERISCLLDERYNQVSDGGIPMFTKDVSDYLPPSEPGVFYIVQPQDARGMNRSDLLVPMINFDEKYLYRDTAARKSTEICQGFIKV